MVRISPAHPTGGDVPGSSALAAATRSLLVDMVTAEVTAAFRAAGVRSILLKGPAIARWLYDDGAVRTYVDCDLLVAPPSVSVAEEVLRALGFAPGPLDSIAGDWPRHAKTWMRGDHGNVDLHRTFTGLDVDADRAWEILSARTERMRVAGADVEVLDVPARALLLALHAAKDGPGVAKVRHDLGHALERVPFETWQEAAALSHDLGADGALAVGLGLKPAGLEIVRRLNLSDERSVLVALRARGAPPMATGIEWLRNEPSWRRRATVVLRKTVPPPEYVRAWSPLARRGRIGLVAAYVGRPVWMAWRAGPALFALRRARRDAR